MILHLSLMVEKKYDLVFCTYVRVKFCSRSVRTARSTYVSRTNNVTTCAKRPHARGKCYKYAAFGENIKKLLWKIHELKMQSSLPDQTIDCLGRCINNLTTEELAQITENVHRTLTHPKGNELFASYLEQFPDSLACLNVYNICSKYLAEEQSRGNSSDESLESLVTKVKTVQATVFDLNEIDFRLMKQFKVALETKGKEALLTVLEDTKVQCQHCLRKMHERFRDYILRYKSTST